MSKRLAVQVLITFLAVTLLATSALAGGWATITLDDWPAGASVGQPVELRFTIRQHGQDRARMNDLEPVIQAKNLATGESLVVAAFPVGVDGVYRAVITFPSAGEWSWSIQAFSMQQPMPYLLVQQAAAKSPSAGMLNPSQAINLGLLGLVGTAVALGIALIRKVRWALVLAAISLFVAGAGFAYASEEPPPSQPAGEIQWSPEEYGAALFVAKGCVTCHLNQKIDKEFVIFTTEVGPDLTHFQAAPEYLRIWLKDPLSVRPPKNPDFPMPNLELDSGEIEALIAFINSQEE